MVGEVGLLEFLVLFEGDAEGHDEKAAGGDDDHFADDDHVGGLLDGDVEESDAEEEAGDDDGREEVEFSPEEAGEHWA